MMMTKLIDSEELKRILADTDYDVHSQFVDGFSYQTICDIINFMPAAEAVTYDDLRRLLESDI